MKKILLTLGLILFLTNGFTYAKPFVPDAEENNIQLYFLNPLKQKRPENKCNSTACKALLENIKKADESIDFAIYGINDQDKIFNALVKAQKRGVKIRWVTDLNEKNRNIYYDTYKLMQKIPTYKTDYLSQKNEAEKTKNYEFPQTAIMHNKFFIFDNKKVSALLRLYSVVLLISIACCA